MNADALECRPLGAGYVVIAEFEVIPDRLCDFIALAQGFADECIESESGCWQFDVVRIESSPSAILFYEVYDGIGAFDEHRQTSHLARFKKAFKKMIVAERPLRLGSRGHSAT
ncbi:putative quinol monooxygenase [Propionivibrio dicarboxylicus]|uniref:Quinol monooxygenase YgiN n=1 Tax=Propionivibrio dicarboxylicus TaxID=83767 RepID=A0A1G8KF58_9RHOO|nr:putative quinol monooxygenase [Propionivibrio dicarboxylicus]SDI41510.1 Quinol monooxygenase YgiN [Propionivibrio dicarboxylicus]